MSQRRSFSLQASASSSGDGSSSPPPPASEGTFERLRRSAPFFDSPDLFTSSVTYSGPLASFAGADAVTTAMSLWKEGIPSRLEQLKVENVQLFPVSEDVSGPVFNSQCLCDGSG